jgi:hypothetical protein
VEFSLTGVRVPSSSSLKPDRNRNGRGSLIG